MRLLSTVGAALVLAAPASAADRGVTASGPVGALEVTGAEVAYSAVAGRCVEVRVWSTADRGNRRYARHCFEQTSTGSGVAGVAVAGGRALWLAYTGGNVREWMLWTATRGAPRPRLLRFVSRDVDAAPPIVLGRASDSALVYAIDRTVVAVRPNGARSFAWEAPERVAAVQASARGYAVTLASGDVVTLNLGGAQVRRHAFAPREVRAAVLGAPGLIVHLPGRLLIRNVADRTLPLPGNARFFGFAPNVVAYGTGTELRLLRPSDGRDVVLRRLPAGARAELDRVGLAYASGGRVSWVGRAAVLAALAGS